VILPLPEHCLFCEVQKGSGDLRVPLYEVPVVPSEPQEPVDFSYIVWLQPFFDPVDLHLVHSYFAFHNLYSEEVEVILFKCAFFQV
jgi:hypothetical protein